MERVGTYSMFDRDLFVLDMPCPDDMPGALSFPCPYFACLIALDARPYSDEVLVAMSAKLLHAGCVYACCWGPDCSRVHDCFDLAELQVRSDGPWAMTTWHRNDPLSEALWFLLHCAAPDPAYFDGCQAAVGISIGMPVWASEMRLALTNPQDFSAKVLAED